MKALTQARMIWLLLLTDPLHLNLGPLAAQATRATVTGMITDSATGAPLSLASVQIVGTTIGVTTNSDGRYSISSIPAGLYTFRVSRIGYKPVTHTEFRVRAGATLVADFKMSPQSVIPGLAVTTGMIDPFEGKEPFKLSTDAAPHPVDANYGSSFSKIRAPSPERPTVILSLPLIRARTNEVITITNAGPPQSDWSAAVNGIRGRLIIAWQIVDGTPGQFKLELELENVSDAITPKEIWWTGLNSMLAFTVEDETGKSLPAETTSASQNHPQPLWLPLMSKSSVKVVVANMAYDIDHPSSAVTLRLAAQRWMLPKSPLPSELYIRGVLRSQQAAEQRSNAWLDSLVLPRFRIPIAYP